MNAKMSQYSKVVVGPYKGYFGVAEYDADDGCFNGRVQGLSDVITFVTKDHNKVAREFAVSVDDYLEFCAKVGHKPDKPKSGKFVVRVKPGLHEAVSALSEADGVSLNTFVEGCLEKVAKERFLQATAPTTMPVKIAKKTVKHSKLRNARRIIGRLPG